jgi:hypothetical protein
LDVCRVHNLQIPEANLVVAKWLHTEKRWQRIGADKEAAELALLLAQEEKKRKEKEVPIGHPLCV